MIILTVLKKGYEMFLNKYGFMALYLIDFHSVVRFVSV